ncbi:WD40-repeat-containing domain protein, partial [Crepidotus variabilis]
MSSRLRYLPFLSLAKSGDFISTCSLSPLGLFLAATTAGGSIMLWKLPEGRECYPRLESGDMPSCLQWLPSPEIPTLLCGTETGMLHTLKMKAQSGTLTISGQALCQLPMKTLAYDTVRGLAAIAGHEVHVYSLTGRHQWIRIQLLPLPTPISIIESHVEPTSIAWLCQEAESQLLVGYQNHGIVLWDTTQLTTVRLIKGQSIGGVLCSHIQQFASVNSLQNLEVYSIVSGLQWRPLETCQSFDHIEALVTVHSGNGIAVQSQGFLHIIDLKTGYLLQSVKFGHHQEAR